MAPRKPAPAPTNTEGGPAPDEKRLVTVASAISHDGEDFGIDDAIVLTFAEFEKLRPTGALVEGAWDDCSPLE